MSVQENMAVARRAFDEVWSQGKVELVDELLAPDWVGRPGGLGEPLEGPEAAKEWITRLRDGFPDITFTIEEMVADGDFVATRWIARGTHEGTFKGMEPTGRSATIGGMTFQRFEDGRIAEGWSEMDALGLFMQLGAMPEAARA